MNATRRRNVAKLIVHSAVDEFLEQGGMDDMAMGDAIRDIQSSLLRSMGDRAYDLAEADYGAWRES